MKDEQTPAASSTAVVEAPLEIPSSGSREYAEWRATGELPKPKPAAPATADAPKETKADDAGSSAAKETQEQPKTKRRPDVEQRIQDLTQRHKDEIARLTRELEDARRPKDAKADPSPAKVEQPQTYKEWREKFKPTEWANRYVAEHKDATMAEVSAALADYMGDVRDQYRTVEQQITTLRQSVGQKLSEAKERYQDFDSVAGPVLQDLLKSDISREVSGVLNDSPVLADLLYVIGGSEQSKQDFLAACRSNPSKALRMALLIEQEINAELTKGTEKPTDRNEKGQFTKPVESAPAKKGPEDAPAPPIEIGHRGGGAMDEAARALQAAERGDANAFRDFKRAEDRKALARRRGV
jgi:hypothetical protein